MDILEMLLQRSDHIRFVILNALIFALSLLLIESKKERAWNCMAEKCCSIDFSKMLKSVDYVRKLKWETTKAFSLFQYSSLSVSSFPT